MLGALLCGCVDVQLEPVARLAAAAPASQAARSRPVTAVSGTQGKIESFFRKAPLAASGAGEAALAAVRGTISSV